MLAAQLLIAEGRLQRQGEVIHVVAERLIDRTDLLRRLGEAGAPPFRSPLAPADEAKGPQERRAGGFASRDYR